MQHKNRSLHNTKGKWEIIFFILILEHLEDYFETEGDGRHHFTPTKYTQNNLWEVRLQRQL